MNEWHRQASRVYGKGQSYNLHNNITAETLQNTLNNYENKIHELQTQINTQNNHKQIQAYLVKITMDLSILKHDIDTLKEALE